MCMCMYTSKSNCKTKTTNSFIQTHNELFDSHESSVLLMIANIFLKKPKKLENRRFIDCPWE